MQIIKFSNNYTIIPTLTFASLYYACSSKGNLMYNLILLVQLEVFNSDLDIDRREVTRIILFYLLSVDA